MRTALAILVFVVACGGGGKKSDTQNTGGDTTSTDVATAGAADGVYGGATYGGYKRTPELTAFHDAIATKTKAADACPASATLHTAADAIVKSPAPPPANPEMWTGEANELLAIAEDLVTSCAGTDAAETQYNVDSLHRSYQRLLLQLPR
jgi:hypothetical protein